MIRFPGENLSLSEVAKPVSYLVLFFFIWNSPIQAADTIITSGNPIIRHIRSADPAAEVWNDGQVWIYASHDQDDATDYSTIDGYHVFSSYDMVNWTDHGEILHSRDVDWGIAGGGWMFAPDAAFKDGTYFLYFPHLANAGGWRIGVATSDRPEGPFTDIGHYIDGTDNFDPTCFVDEDGQAYLLWGGSGENPKIARLKENMTELAETPRIIEYGATNFGEGGYLHKRNGTYYFSYTCNTCYPYQGYYSMGNDPYGPFEYKGALNPAPPGAQDHHSMVEFHGQWYYFYHVGNYGSGGTLFRRNICVDSLFYREDGTMEVVRQTSTGVGLDMIGSTPGIIIPGRIEAADFYRSSGIDTTQTGDSTSIVTQVQNGDWVEYVLQVLGTEEFTATMDIADPRAGTSLVMLVDDVPVDTLVVDPEISLISFPFYVNRGKHTLKILFSNADTTTNLLNFYWIELLGERIYFSIKATASPGGSVGPAGTSYFESGESAEYAVTAEANHVLDSISVDGKVLETSPSTPTTYTFNMISGNHTLEAWFSQCPVFQSTPFYRVDNWATVNGTDIRLNEGEDLKLWISFEESGSVSWSGPRGLTGSGKELYVDSILAIQAGVYTADITYGQGCMTAHDYTVTVDYYPLDVYEAEAFYLQSGIRLETSYDLGGGSYVASIENNDWCSYLIGIDDPGVYALTARVATASEGGIIEVLDSDTLIAEIPVSSTLSGGWQDWYTTVPVEVGFEEGMHRLTFAFMGDTGTLFNFNWFYLQYLYPQGQMNGISPGTSMGSRLRVYPNPVVSNISIVYTLDKKTVVDLTIYSANGAIIRSLTSPAEQMPGTYTVTWDATNTRNRRVHSGIYFVRFRCNDEVAIRKIILL